MKNKEEIKFILSLGIVFVLIFFIFHSSTTSASGTGYNLNNDPFGSTLVKASPGNFIKETGGEALKAVFVVLLTGVLAVVGWLLSAAISIFTWAVDVNVFNAILANNGAIYQTWQTVRDFFNIAFILVLLFSAFATIFQIEKYNYKKILLMVVLMALLVNFSFPIARFVIDVSNSLMYTLIKGLGIDPSGATGVASDPTLVNSNIFARFAEYAKVNKILSDNRSGDIPSLLAAIIFLFILMLTFMAMAVLFLIRVIALAIIVIFSPIAFVGAILPNSLGSGKWWDYLFKYSFFGPAMIFMIFVAQRMMTATSETYLPIMQATQTNTTAGNLVAPMAIFAIPVVILWIGMGVAQQMSIFGASTIVGSAQKVAKWAGKKFSGYNAVKKQYDDYKDIKKNERNERLKREPHLVDKTLAVFGNKKAQERITKKQDAANKDDIKKAAEGNDGIPMNSVPGGAPGLYEQIENDAKKTTRTHEEHIAAAGRVKAAMAHGKEYEKEIEKNAKAEYLKTQSGVKKPDELTTAEAEKLAKKTLFTFKGSGTPAEILKRQESRQERDKEITEIKEARKREITKYEKEEKKAIEDMRERAFEQNRKTIAAAEASQKKYTKKP